MSRGQTPSRPDYLQVCPNTSHVSRSLHASAGAKNGALLSGTVSVGTSC